MSLNILSCAAHSAPVVPAWCLAGGHPSLSCSCIYVVVYITTSERVVSSCLFDLLSESYFLLDNTAVSVPDTCGRLRNTFDNLARNDYIYKM